MVPFSRRYKIEWNGSSVIQFVHVESICTGEHTKHRGMKWIAFVHARHVRVVVGTNTCWPPPAVTCKCTHPSKPCESQEFLRQLLSKCGTDRKHHQVWTQLGHKRDGSNNQGVPQTAVQQQQ